VSAPWLSVIVPAYNEEAAIARTIETLHARLGALGRAYEIVVVDNGSVDGTVAALEPLLDDRVRVLCNGANRGKGFSVRRGMLDATGQLRLMCDADCGPSLASLPDMLRAIEHADVVAGSRSAAGAQVDRQQPLRRRLVGWPFIALTRTLMREPTKDVYCGFKLWRADAAQAVFSRQRLTGWVFDAEVLALARGLGYRVTEIGVEWADRRGSKLSIAQVLLPAVRELLAARRNVRAQLHQFRHRREAQSEPSPERPDGQLVADSASAERGA
jgi:dolichyl-phosphate beta-glucosyltransferase